jgi:hypothetical protein
MKRYYLQSRVTTGTKILAKYTHDESEKDVRKRFKSEFEYEWLNFEQWDFSIAEWAFGDAWIVYNEVEANNFAEAINIHLKKLSQVLPRVFFCAPVWHSFGFHESLLISNDEFQTGFYFMRKEREWTWLVITDEILQVLESKNFQNIPDKFLLYYSEFINANTALSWLSLWMSALEIIRPESNLDRKKLFGEELYFKIYWTKPEWIRHKIHHGKYPEEWDNSEKDFEEMHEAIRLCLLGRNSDIQKIYSLRSGFVGIPRQKKVIEWHNWIYLLSNNQKPLNLREIVKYDDTALYEFQKKIKENLSILIDNSKKSNDY